MRNTGLVVTLREPIATRGVTAKVSTIRDGFLLITIGQRTHSGV
jgi:hypothetical protein